MAQRVGRKRERKVGLGRTNQSDQEYGEEDGDHNDDPRLQRRVFEIGFRSLKGIGVASLCFPLFFPIGAMRRSDATTSLFDGLRLAVYC